MRIETGSAKSTSINCLLGGWGTATGKAWWDDVSLRKVEYEIIASDEPEVVKGDVVSGKKIFMTHPIAACTRCHVVNGAGGPIGPALDTIATRKKEDYILQSLVDPGATIAEGYVGKVSPMPPMGVLFEASRVGRRVGLHPDAQVTFEIKIMKFLVCIFVTALCGAVAAATGVNLASGRGTVDLSRVARYFTSGAPRRTRPQGLP